MEERIRSIEEKIAILQLLFEAHEALRRAYYTARRDGEQAKIGEALDKTDEALGVFLK